jgi:DNA modification methylase
MLWEIKQGDIFDVIKTIPDKSIHCVITSPPYWGLRDYGTANWEGGDPNCDHSTPRSRGDDIKPGDKQGTSKGSRPNKQHICSCGAIRVDNQIGLENTPEEYVEKLVKVFREVRRVLRDDGTLWLNLGDCFAGSGKAGNNPEYQKKHTQFGTIERKERLGKVVSAKSIGLKNKDIVCIPWMVAIALRNDGWYLRSGMPWLKNSVMPEPVTDRPASSVEYFFLLSKSQHYYYDSHAIKKKGVIIAGTKAAKGSEDRFNTKKVNSRPPEYKEYDGIRNRRNSDWFMQSLKDIINGVNGTLLHNEDDVPVAIFCNPHPYKEAHFATYSPELIRPMIIASTSQKGCCPKCGSPWERIVLKPEMINVESSGVDRYGNGQTGVHRKVGQKYQDWRVQNPNKTIGWEPTCSCGIEETIPCVVLDPFSGSGTTGAVAVELGRMYIGVELNPEYCKLGENRIKEHLGYSKYFEKPISLEEVW